ncbi:putative transposase [Citreimonas salinaria]|uniref:Putative transposase n=1 Tax=Citreimonas salinaria TaxID=321339 RepID=A0A1H3LHQ1_9RHOB|nr:putative transposase [Citreimonas salinaria]
MRWCGSTESPPALSASCHWSAIGPSDNGDGTEFISRASLKWADEKVVPWHNIGPEKPQQNAFIELFNGSFRGQLLKDEIFDTRDDARRKLALWRHDYNDGRLHSSL